VLYSNESHFLDCWTAGLLDCCQSAKSSVRQSSSFLFRKSRVVGWMPGGPSFLRAWRDLNGDLGACTNRNRYAMAGTETRTLPDGSVSVHGSDDDGQTRVL
jgi:hypothetical protein